MPKKHYKYEITFNRPIYPRHLFDMLTMRKDLRKSLISIKDLQCKEHFYGDTYKIKEKLKW